MADYIQGIDVSEWQGEIDWTKVAASGIEFAIMRVYEGWYQDIKAVANVQGAQQNGIAVGLYQFSRADSIERATAEGRQMVAFANEYCPDIELPIFFDWELDGTNTTGAQLQDWAEAFCDTVEAGGYKAGVYYNWNLSKIAYIDSWFAEHSSYMRWFAFPDSGEPENVDGFHIWQNSWVGSVPGISGNVDLDLMKYTEPDPDPDPEPEPDPEPDPDPDIQITAPLYYKGIEYVEIRDVNTTLLGIVDTAESIIWHSVYFGVGDFEIYAQASPEIIALLQVDNLVTRPDDLEVGIIEKINIADDPASGMMITATGRFAKSILERRLIYNHSGITIVPTILIGNVETEVRRIVKGNAIACAFDSRRNIPQLALGELAGLQHMIVNENGVFAAKQVSCENLLTYTDALLQEYGLAATVILDEAAGKLRYVIYEGANRSWDNTAGNDPIIFGKDYDNLTSSSYDYDTTTEKNTALIGGDGEGLLRFYSLITGAQEGLQRRELWVDVSSLSRTYKDDNDEEKTYTNDEYRAMLNTAGTQQLSAHTAAETFDATIDIQNNRWLYNRDFALGDIVTTQNEDIGRLTNVRLCEILEVQDQNGYSIEASTKANNQK